MLQKCYFLLLSFVIVSLGRCAVTTFDSTIVEILQNGKQSKQVIDGCIAPEQILYTPGEDLHISLKGVHVPVLQKGAISNFQENLTLYLFDSNIETIKEGALSNLPLLNAVSFNNSNVKTIEQGNFKNMAYLHGILMGNNKIEYFAEATFDNLPALKIVSLRRNQLRHFTQQWFNLTPNLETLLLADNLILEITRLSFKTLPNLRTLDLSGNLIETIHRKGFKGLKKLQSLYLSNNKLKVFDSKLYSPLEILALQFNNITYISDETLQLLPKSSHFRMEVTSNPLQCSCFDKMLRWSADNKIKLTWKCKDENPVCVNPKTNKFYCIERTDEDFYEGYYLQFSKDCHEYGLQFPLFFL